MVLNSNQQGDGCLFCKEPVVKSDARVSCLVDTVETASHLDIQVRVSIKDYLRKFDGEKDVIKSAVKSAIVAALQDKGVQ